MRKVLISFLITLFPVCVFGNVIQSPQLPAIDYFRGTAGEQLFFYYPDLKKGSLNINNDFRFCILNNYFNHLGEKIEIGYIKRLINVFSLNYSPLNKTQFSVRIPYVNTENKWSSNSGLSDIFLGLTYEIKQLPNIKVLLSSGVKFPVGYYEIDDIKAPLGTGSFDVPIIINSIIQIGDGFLFADAGYIFNGKSKIESRSGDVLLEHDIGNEIFSDIVFMKPFFKELVFKLEINSFYVFEDMDRWERNYSKLSFSPGILFTNKSGIFIIDLGISYDLWGKNVYFGYSPILRVHFNK